MTNKPMLSVERNKFEAFWRATMNVEVMDLHRCEFPMTAYDDQPYACHETDRAWMTWKGCALLDNQAAQHQGEPVAQSEFEPDAICLESDGCPTEGAVLKRFWRENQPDPVLCEFYEAEDFPSLVRELVGHIAQLQDAAKRNVKPWEDTFPPTLLPAYIARINAEQPAPVAVVMPEPYGLAMFKMLSGFDSVTPEQFNLVWTACRKEVARLNGVEP